MKWLGQYIQDLTSRFRDDVYLESISTGTIASGAHLGLDSNNKIVKAADGGGDLTAIVAGTGLSGTSLSGPIPTLNVDAEQTHVTAVGTIAAGVWNGTAVTSAYLDSDTAHLTTAQTFTSVKTFAKGIIIDGDYTETNTTDGAAVHVDASDITDGTTSASGTVAAFRHVSIEAPRLLATNSSVTTTNASTLYIKGPPIASTNQTITNTWALLVDSGNARFDGDIDLEGDMDINGTLETDALTVGGTNVLTGSLITTLGTISAGVWNGTVIASSYLDADTAHLSGTQSFTGTKTFDETISGAIDGNAATATTLATTRAINGVNFNGSAAITIPTNRVYATKIKLLPNDFLPNEDGGTSKGVHLDDSAPTGLKPGIAAMELVAIQDIPEGFKATHVDVYASTNLVIQAYEMDLNASGITSRSSAGNANTTLDITDVNATATNFIAIIVTTTATSNRVWGGTITIAPQ